MKFGHFVRYLSPDDNSGGGSGGANDGSGGTGEKNQNKNLDDGSGGTGDEGSKQTVAYETHQKLLRERKKDQELLRELQAKEKAREEEKLKEQGNFQTLLKQREEELKKEREEKQRLVQEREDGLRLNALLKHMSGTVERQYWALFDLDKVAIDPSSGKVDEATAQAAAKAFEAQYGKVVEKKSNAKLPQEAAQGGASGGGFETEIKAAKTQKEFDAVMKKYGKA